MSMHFQRFESLQSLVLFVLAFVPMSALGGSGCAVDEASACGATQALYGGDSDPTDFGIDARLVEAIGALTDSASPAGFICSAVLVGPSTVLTAKHCIFGGTVAFSLGADLDAPEATFRARGVLPHAALDLALVPLVESAGDLASPIPILAEEVVDQWVGRDVVLSGFGRTGQGDGGNRLFLQETVVSIEPESLTVRGQGETGACAGDSGGPLLIVIGDMVPAAVGVLSKGAATCTGIDVYVRLDRALPWLEAEGATIASGAALTSGDARRGACTEAADG